MIKDKDGITDVTGEHSIPSSPLARRRRPVRHAETPYDPSTDDGTTFYGEGLDMPSYGD